MECEPKGQQTSSDTYILFIEYRFCIHIQTSVNRDQISFVLPLRPVASEASVPLTLFSVEALIVRSCSISGLIFLWEQLVDTLMDKINIFLSFCCYPIITVNIQILSLNLFSKITRCPLNIFSFNVNLKICSFESCYLLKSSPTGALIINKGKLCRRVSSFVLKSCRQSWLFSYQQKQPSTSTAPQTGGVGSDSEVWNQTQAVCMSNLLQSETINKQRWLQTSKGMTSTEKKRINLIIYCS